MFSIHDFERVDAFYNPVAENRGFVADNVIYEWPGDEDQGSTERMKFDML